MTADPHSKDHDMRELLRRARAAARCLRLLPGPQKNAFLQAVAAALLDGHEAILQAAQNDAAHARAHGASEAVAAGIVLTRADLEGKVRLAGTLAGLPDPIGRVESTWIRPNGLKIEKTRVPLGVVAVLVESDVGAVIDALLLCAKAGDAVVLCAGPMIIRTCTALSRVLSAASLSSKSPLGALCLVPGHDEASRRLLVADRAAVDVAIPVGSPAWVQGVVAASRVPILGQTDRGHHLFLDEDADPAMAVALVLDLAQGAAVGEGPCRVLVHSAAAAALLPALAAGLRDGALGFEAAGAAAALLQQERWSPPGSGVPAEPALRLELVDGVDQAAALIGEHGPGLSAGVVTNNRAVATRFAALVDAACVYLNASSRFTDGGQFGMGAQITVSTGRLHARGPVAIDELTTTKYVVTGKGQTLE